MYDPNNGTLDLYWDANGNLAQVIGCVQNSGRLHEWDVKRNSRTEKSPVDSSRSKCGARVCQSKHRTQLDRLRFVLGEKYAGYYGYDANGERVYKLTGMSVMDQVNSGSTKAQAIFDEAVLYPNPYIVISQTGYTKHYYAGTERIATVIGTGGFDDMVTTIDKSSSQHDWDIVKTFYSYYQNYDPFFYQKIVSQPEKTEDIFGQPSPDLEYQCKPTELVMVDILNPPDILLKSISINRQNNSPENEVYFYHGDHLGSANWITDYTGAPIQYIHYAPYGELIDNQQATQYDERYKFTGKERDWETGYDYFGARYWWLAGTWLSVDPLAGDYPWISPYAYCAWNPVKYVDPDGRDVWELSDDGTIKARIRDKTQDAIAIKRKSISFDYGTIDMGFHGRERNNTNYTYFQFAEGKENEAAAAFKFLADNSSVEYALVNTDKNVSGVYTNRNKDYVYSGFAAARVEGFTGAKMTDNYHSHTNGTMFPSGLTDVQGDMRFAKNKGDSYNYYIYPAKSNGVIEYFSDGSYISVLQPWPYKNVGTISPYVRQSGVPALLRRLGIKL